MSREAKCSLVPSLSAPVFTSLAVRKTEGEPGRFDHATPWHRVIAAFQKTDVTRYTCVESTAQCMPRDN